MGLFIITQDLVATVSPEKAATEILINAHQHDISCICMNQQGTMIATCSSKVHRYSSGVPAVFQDIPNDVYTYQFNSLQACVNACDHYTIQVCTVGNFASASFAELPPKPSSNIVVLNFTPAL